MDDVVLSFRVLKERHHPLRSEAARRISAAAGVRVMVPEKAHPSDIIQVRRRRGCVGCVRCSLL